MLHQVSSILRKSLLDAAFLAAAAGGLILVLAAPGSVAGPGQPPPSDPDPLPEFSVTPTDTTPAPWVPGKIPRTHADSLLAARADSTHRDSVRADSLRTARRKYTISDTT
ncbi:MAG TPA: hypothetical protein VMM80_06465, partial [Bacteroidota bacterium]|nr:hypothetical protein [Bacteroidota bacterium]